jgi:hypothetical protein
MKEKEMDCAGVDRLLGRSPADCTTEERYRMLKHMERCSPCWRKLNDTFKQTRKELPAPVMRQLRLDTDTVATQLYVKDMASPEVKVDMLRRSAHAED